MHIRPFDVDRDLDQVVALYMEEASWHEQNWPDQFRTPDAAPLWQGLRELGANADACLFVATDDDRLTGVVSGELSPPPTQGLNRFDGAVLHVGDLVVTGTYRRKGIGTALMQAVEAWGLEHGARTITLQVQQANTGALTLYERGGFRPTRVTMRKELD